MRPSTREALLAEAVKGLIQNYAITCDVCPSKLAGIANLSTQLTHRLTSPAWKPSLKTLDRLFDTLPEDWKLRLPSEFSSISPVDILLPLEDAGRQFSLIADLPRLTQTTFGDVSEVIAAAEAHTTCYVLYECMKGDFRTLHVGADAHACKYEKIPAGGLLSQRSNRVLAEFVAHQLTNAMIRNQPVFALVQQPEHDGPVVRYHSFYTLRVPISVIAGRYCLSLATPRRLVNIVRHEHMPAPGRPRERSPRPEPGPTVSGPVQAP